MKRFNIYTGFVCSCLFLLLTVSCNQENAGEKYLPGENESVSFLASENSILAPPSATTATYIVVRGNVNGRLELPITANCDQDIFTIPSSIVFEDGNGKAELSIPLEKTTLGESYPISLSFDSVKSSPFGHFKTTINVMRDYNWLPAGVAEMYSGWVGNEEGIDVNIEHADGSNPARYRLISPYYVMEPDYCEKPGFHLVFELDADYNALRFLDGQKIGEIYEDNGDDIYLFSANNGDTFTNEGNEFTVTGTFYISLGAFGQIPEVFIWTEGYPGNTE
ncbi:MAG: hypothetical protein LBH90_07010 [Tannerella sp.]|nr:hypothetical protein [Tannerella sp.]